MKFKSLVTKECLSCAGIILSRVGSGHYTLVLSPIDNPTALKTFKFYFRDKRVEQEDSAKFDLEDLIFDLKAVMVNRLNQAKIKGSITFKQRVGDFESILAVIESEDSLTFVDREHSGEELSLKKRSVLSVHDTKKTSFILDSQFKAVTHFFMETKGSEVFQPNSPESQETLRVLFNLQEERVIQQEMPFKRTMVSFLLAKGNTRVLEQILASTSIEILPLNDLSKMFELTVEDQIKNISEIFRESAKLQQIFDQADFEREASALDLNEIDASLSVVWSAFDLDSNFLHPRILATQDNQKNIRFVDKRELLSNKRVEAVLDDRETDRLLPLVRMTAFEFVLKLLDNVMKLIDCFYFKIVRESKVIAYEHQLSGFLQADRNHLKKIKELRNDCENLRSKMLLLRRVFVRPQILESLNFLVETSKSRKKILKGFVTSDVVRKYLEGDSHIKEIANKISILDGGSKFLLL